MARLVAPFAAALRLFVTHQFDDAATVLLGLIPNFGPVGGSAAQRSVLEDTAIAALLRAGDGQQACQLLDAAVSSCSSQGSRAPRQDSDDNSASVEPGTEMSYSTSLSSGTSA